jgi:hypothetical protein
MGCNGMHVTKLVRYYTCKLRYVIRDYTYSILEWEEDGELSTGVLRLSFVSNSKSFANCKPRISDCPGQNELTKKKIPSPHFKNQFLWFYPL